MANKTNREKLKVIVSHAKMDVNLCAVAYQMLKASDSEDRPLMLADFIKGVRRSESDGSMKLPVVITKPEEANLMGRYGSYVDQKLEKLIAEGPEEKEFYERLSEFFFNDEMLQDGKAGTIAIFDCVIDKRLPYHKVSTEKAISMDQEHFVELINRIGDDALETIESVLSYDFEQKTERASVVLDLIESREDPEERIIMLTRVFQHFEKQMLMMHQREIKRSLLRDLLEDD